MRRSGIDKVDRISVLPEPILQHILSFLSLKDVVRTSILSKTWKQVWHTFPVLEFDDRVCHPRRAKMILKFLEQTLLNRQMEMISINKFILHMVLSNDPVFSSYINRCLCYAIGSNVKELKLNFHSHHGRYNLSQIIFHAKSVDVLELKGCKLELPRSLVKLSSLRKLFLSYVDTDDQVIENLVAGCPLIEQLDVHECSGFKSLDLFSLRNLKKFKVFNNDELERVFISGVNVYSVDIVRLLGPCEINVAACTNLKCLKLFALSITDKCLCSQISELLFLEHLEIDGCMELRSIKISSHHMKKLFITNCMLVEITIDTPNLSIFKYLGTMVSFSSNALALSETELGFDSYNVDDHWFMKLVELLAKFNHFSKVINLQSRFSKAMIVPRNLREILHPPLTRDRHVNLAIGNDAKFPLAKLVDGLLWISPHTETLSMRYRLCYHNQFSFQFSYKENLVDEGDTPRCCQSRPVSCWKHCIKEVKMEHTRRDGNEIVNVVSYSFEGEEILEEIDKLYSSVLTESWWSESGDDSATDSD